METSNNSDVLRPDDYVMTHLRKNTDSTFCSTIKVVLRSCVTPQLVSETNKLQIHLKAVNLFMLDESIGDKR